MKPFDSVTKYAERTASEEKSNGKLHILACKRHLEDLERQGTANFPYVWNVEKANEIIEYAETLTILEGAEPKPVKLIEAQKFDLGCTFGWTKLDGKRRFRRRYKSMARQNGKTFENGIMGTYIAGFSGYNYGRLFTVATKKRQARLAWDEMKKFIEADKDLNKLFSIKDYKSLITAIETQCTIEALSRESGLDDGFRSIYSSIDELHQHRDNKIYKSLYNGTKTLPETLVSMITTRGDKLNSFCKEMDDYCINILNKTAVAEDFFVDIYALDDGDDIYSENNWVKANPLLALNGNLLQSLQNDARTARDMGGSDLRDFMTKSLNMWVQNRDDRFIDAAKWQRCGTDKTLESFRGRRCFVGLDLSSGGDLTTAAIEFVDGSRYYFYSHSFMPRGRLEEHIETDIAPYDLWERSGLITVTGGSNDYKNDYRFIIRHLYGLKNEYALEFVGIGVDPHNFDGIRADLEDFGCPVIIVTQSARSLNDTTVDMQLLVKSESVEYDRKNELMTWSFVNAAVVHNSFGEIKVDKQERQRYKRIDPVDACIDAHFCYLKLQATEPVDAESELNNYLEMMGWN